ncbi:sporulation protein YpjB [Alkalihalobacterium alkalinitrilicum]|uniref:sporulation protein YpjB n=1 Tax=Alkalihalobacterium alkalinitrilicum TaxID=427920 RepID=UPI001EE42AE6|nr:sporulation protein YpjB [Alkalihalobacterium alkalinitrilicum]
MLIFVLCMPTYSNASEHKEYWSTLNETSDKVLQLVKQEKHEEARQLLDYFSKQFLALDHTQTSLTMSDLQIVTKSFERAMESVTAVSMTQIERVRLATEFRLVVDALASPHHPLWLSTEQTMMKAMNELKGSMEQKDVQAFRHKINEFLRSYQMVRPALIISVEGVQVQKIESLVQFLDRYGNDMIQDTSMQKQLFMLESELENLYQQVKEDSADPSLIWVMLTIGGTIIISLSYVGWKKYRAEKRRVKVRD